MLSAGLTGGAPWSAVLAGGRYVQRRIAAEEAGRLQREPAPGHGHHRPVLRPRKVRGPERVPQHDVGAVNVAEVYTYAAINELPTEAIDAFFADTGIEIVSFDPAQAVTAGRLASVTRKAGLSLGDRSCLALAKLRNAEVLTADRPWRQVAGATGLTITVLR